VTLASDTTVPIDHERSDGQPTDNRREIYGVLFYILNSINNQFLSSQGVLRSESLAAVCSWNQDVAPPNGLWLAKSGTRGK
jgi:hypothetical protein